MTSVLKSLAISAGVLAVIAYAIYRYMKGKSSKPISYESILKSAISHIKENKDASGVYDLVIFPPSKANDFLTENPDFFDDVDININVNDVKDKKLVIWFVQQEGNVLYHEARLSDSLAPDFTDAVSSDKIYKKRIKITE